MTALELAHAVRGKALLYLTSVIGSRADSLFITPVKMARIVKMIQCALVLTSGTISLIKLKLGNMKEGLSY